jgi:hypothetical protein
VCNYVGLYEYVRKIMWVYMSLCVLLGVVLVCVYNWGLYEYVCVIMWVYIICVCNYVGLYEYVCIIEVHLSMCV